MSSSSWKNTVHTCAVTANKTRYLISAGCFKLYFSNMIRFWTAHIFNLISFVGQQNEHTCIAFSIKG